MMPPDYSRFCTAIAMTITLFGTWLLTGTYKYGVPFRLEFWQSWMATAGFAFFAGLGLLVAAFAADYSRTPKQVYSTERRCRAYERRFRSKYAYLTGLSRLAGFLTLALGVFICVSAGWKGPGSVVTPYTALLTAALGLILAGLSRTWRLEPESRRIVERWSLFGLGIQRTTHLSHAAKVRLRGLWRLEGGYRPVYSNCLEIVDGDLSIPTHYSPTSENASALARTLELDSYQEVLDSYLERLEAPEGLTLTVEKIRERPLKHWMLPGVFSLFLLLAVPGAYYQTLKMEGVRPDTTAALETYQLCELGLELEKEEKFEEAFECFAKLRGAEDQIFRGYGLVGEARVLIKLGKTAEGVARLEEFRQLDPKAWRLQGRSSHGFRPWPAELFAQAYREAGKPRLALDIVLAHSGRSWTVDSRPGSHDFLPEGAYFRENPYLLVALLADLEDWQNAKYSLDRIGRPKDGQEDPRYEALAHRVKNRLPDPEVP